MIALLMAGMVCIAGCCACGSNSSAEETSSLQSADMEILEELQTPYVGMILKSLDGQFYPLIKAGAEAEADRLGVDLIVVAPDNEQDAEGQAELLDIMADMALDVLIVAPCEENQLTAGLEKAQANGKHILAVDEPLSFSGCEGCISADNYMGGFREGAYAATVAVAPTAVILRGEAESTNHNERTLGLRTSLARSGIAHITSRICNSSRTEAYQETKQLLAREDTIGVICATDDDMALGAHQAVVESGKTIPIVAFDGTPDMLKQVENGAISGVIMQDAYEIGVRSIQAAVQAAAGESIEEENISINLVVQDTAETYLDTLKTRLNDDEP
jgi:ribose transport system substrate-binding protein